MKNTNNKYILTSYGHTLLVDTSDEIGKEIIKKGIYDRSSIYLLNKILENLHQPIVFDIGANIGNHSISISKACHTIYAFEPDDAVHKVLTENIKINKINNINTYKVGLSNQKCNSDFYININGNIGASTLHPTEDKDKYIKSHIQLITGDQFIKENSIDRIDLIKLDIEGHEIQALEGLQESIRRFKPVISMEWTAEHTILSSSKNMIFNEITQTYASYVALSTLNKSLWPSGLQGRMLRLVHKLKNRERWFLVPADLTKKHANVFFIPRNKQALISHLIYTGK